MVRVQGHWSTTCITQHTMYHSLIKWTTNQNSPAAHLAFLNGNIDAGNLLIHMATPELRNKKNSSGRTPINLKDAYNNRIRKAEDLQAHEKYGSKAKELCKEMYEQPSMN